jgi:hypothetical protein
MPNQPPQPLTPAQLETARRDLTELTGGDWFAQAAAWAGPLLATVLAQQTENARLRGLLRELVPADDPEAGLYTDDNLLYRCIYCGWQYYGTNTPDPQHTPECLISRVRAALAESEPPDVEPL